MKIAQVAPLSEAVPPKLYGGTERIVSYLTEELVAQGHEVTLFASGDSETAARLVPMCERAIRLDKSVRDPMAAHTLLIEQVAQQADAFDVIHWHLDHLPFPIARRLTTPSLTTLHGRLDMPELGPVFREFSDMAVVSISDAQRIPLPAARWVGTVHHGLPTHLLNPPVRPHGYLAFLGRFSPEKQPDAAIRIAREAGMRLRMAAKVDNADQAYFEEVVRPLLAEPHVEFIGEIGEAQKAEFLGGAAALLFPVNWPEPFGLVMIEALACGTPVIAFRRGSVPEVIEHGVTGFIVEDEVGALGAIAQLPRLERGRIRQEFLRRFTAARMAKDYLDIYRELTTARRPQLRVA